MQRSSWCLGRQAALSIAIVALLTTACVGVGGQVVAPKTKGERLYFDGMEYLAEGAFLEAQQTFIDALKLPAYLQVTSLARLRLGDALFHQHKYERAVEQYESYARRHDGSSNVPYARFRIARSYFRMIPTEFWLLPPVFEMDLTSADKARYHLERFIRRYPLSPFATEAAKMRTACIDLQLAHHGYVIAFYAEREKWIGVVSRMHYVMKRFPINAHTPENYAVLAEAYRKLGWRRRALEMNQAIAQRWSQLVVAAQARQDAASIRAEIVRRKAAGEPDAEMPVEPPPSARFRPERATIAEQV